MVELPKTGFSSSIEVETWDAQKFISDIRVQISILECLGKTSESKYWHVLDRKAHELFKFPYTKYNPKND